MGLTHISWQSHTEININKDRLSYSWTYMTDQRRVDNTCMLNENIQYTNHQVAKVNWQRPHRTRSPLPWGDRDPPSKTMFLGFPGVPSPNRTSIRSADLHSRPRDRQTDRRQDNRRVGTIYIHDIYPIFMSSKISDIVHVFDIFIFCDICYIYLKIQYIIKV